MTAFGRTKEPHSKSGIGPFSGKDLGAPLSHKTCSPHRYKPLPKANRCLTSPFSSIMKISFALSAALFLVLIGTAVGQGCCSQNFKDCINWCGTTEAQCSACGGIKAWLPNGAASSCLARWSACTNEPNGCCDGLECKGNQ